VAASTTEAEYVAAGMAAKEALWLWRLVRELGGDDKPVVMHCDSQGAMTMMYSPTSFNRTKHIDVTHHFVHDCVKTAAISVTQVGTADIDGHLVPSNERPFSSVSRSDWIRRTNRHSLVPAIGSRPVRRAAERKAFRPDRRWGPKDSSVPS